MSRKGFTSPATLVARWAHDGQSSSAGTEAVEGDPTSDSETAMLQAAQPPAQLMIATL